MGTRGFVGFVVDNTEKITYNHFDSYPAGLGLDVLTWLHSANVHEVRAAAAALRLVDSDAVAVAEDMRRLGTKYANTNVSTCEPTEWYVLLRETQGDPAAILDAGVMIDNAEFAFDSLFCEFGYLVDLDTKQFEVYVGFQEEVHDRGRFANRASGRVHGYAPVALAASWPLTALPTDDEFLTELDHLYRSR
jgi:hypothetical protein